jgi:N-alpha-acetyltransferase 30
MATSQPSKNAAGEATDEGLRYIQYSPDREEEYVAAIRELVSDQLSEPYSIYVYRYFLYQWGDLCFMVRQTPRLPIDSLYSFPMV